MRGIVIVSVALALGAGALAYAAGTVQVAGLALPLVEQATAVAAAESAGAGAHVARFETTVSVREATVFYEAFLGENGFLTIGGMQPDGAYDVSVKKDNAFFSLRIWAEKGKTIVHFIW